MSKLKFIAAVMCLLAAACQSPQNTELLSNEQLMEGLEDGVASETRFLMQHWGARQEFTFSSSSGCWPRDRRAFGRLLCTGDVDYFIKLAQARDPVVAAYGVEGVRILKRQRLPELLPSLLRRYEFVMTLWDDQGHSMSMPALAALALDQVGAETPDAEIARYLDIWLCRIHDERADANDEKVANSFLRLRSRADLQRMPVSDKAREILPALPILGGTRYYNEHVEGYSTEELAALSLPPGGAARRAALQMFVADRVPIEYVDRVTGALTAALDAARQRAFPAEPDSRSRVQFELERLAVYLTCPDNRRRGAKGLGWFTEAEAFRDLDNATWSYLRSHPNIVVRQSAAAIQAHPFTHIGSDPPANGEDLKYWLFRRGHTFRGDDKEAVDLFLSTKPERVPALPVEEYTSTFRHSYEDDYNDAWFLPCFGGTKNGLPRHWLTFATSSRRDLHFHFYGSIEGVDRDGFNALEGQDKEYFSEVMKCVHRDANGSDLMFKWLARRWLVLYEHLSATDRDGSMNVALRYVDELADDLLKQPRIAPVWYHIARPAAEALCKAAGADYYGEPQSAAHLGSPRWQLLCRLLENSPIFDSKGVWPPEHPEWLTLAEMRKLETEPGTFWRELQRDYVALPK